jgi:hypothetical protein
MEIMLKERDCGGTATTIVFRGLPETVSPLRQFVRHVHDATPVDNRMNNVMASADATGDWLSKVKEKLDSFSSLTKGWNGKSADPPTLTTVVIAEKFIDDLHRLNATPSRVAPSAIGGIGITLKNRATSRRGYVEVRNSGPVFLMLSDGKSDPVISPIRIEKKEFARTIRLIQQFIHGKTPESSSASA